MTTTSATSTRSPGSPETAAPLRTRLPGLLREAALTAGAVAGVLCVLVALAAVTLDLRLVVFRSGSMAPAIETGALAVSRTVPATDLAVGDVVTVLTKGDVRVTHRIEDVALSGDQASLVLRGDANRVVDSDVYVVREADRVLFDIPRAGYVATWLSGPVGMFGGGALAAVALVIAFGRRAPLPGSEQGSEPGSGTDPEPGPEAGPETGPGMEPEQGLAHRPTDLVDAVPAEVAVPIGPTTTGWRPSEPDQDWLPADWDAVLQQWSEEADATGTESGDSGGTGEPGGPRRDLRKPLAVVVCAVALGLALLPAPRQTEAFYTDSAGATSGTFSRAVATPPAPRITGCTVSNGNQTTSIDWTSSVNPSSFEIRYTDDLYPPQSITPGTVRSAELVAGLNNVAGSFWLVAIVPGGESAASNLVVFSGNGTRRVCVPAPVSLP
ncbi:signal peptidase I [Nocardioides donggukensis]|uniref:Signal peptidase I n=1 Tax=Nocardioides donggukensis TaxID=2774019 RepID=A0A927Q315_9ACTN|nr:signal peptidase I [Nocardioides donggukensis]MBD8870914.1 signal peptidase I [Nocardioides donggukensis]